MTTARGYIRTVRKRDFVPEGFWLVKKMKGRMFWLLENPWMIVRNPYSLAINRS